MYLIFLHIYFLKHKSLNLRADVRSVFKGLYETKTKKSQWTEWCLFSQFPCSYTLYMQCIVYLNNLMRLMLCLASWNVRLCSNNKLNYEY